MLKNYLGVFLLLILIFTPVRIDGAMIEVSFREAEVDDVLRGLADIAGKNVLICSQVSGTVSANLEGVTFSEAWAGIIYSQGLAYLKKENIYLVGEPCLIEEIGSDKGIKILDLEGVNPEEAAEWVTEIFPELQVVVDNYSPSIICSGEKDQLESVQKIISQIDFPREGKEVMVLRLNYFPVEEGMQILERLFPELIGFDKTERDLLIIKGPAGEVEKAAGLIQKMDYPLPQRELVIRKLQYGDPEVLASILAGLYPDAEIEIDKRLNRLLLRGKEEILEEMLKVLEEMDQPRELILVEFRIEEVSSNFFKEKGFNLSGAGEINFFKDGFIQGGEGVQISLAKLLELIEEEGISETLARPRLTTLDGIKGTLHIGDRIPVRGERIDNGEERGINYLQTGILISFTPRVSDNEYLTLKVRPEVSTLGEELIGGFPRIRTREAETVVRVKSGETFALGGLLQVQDRLAKKEVPWFRKLPLVGSLFGSSKEDQMASELIIFITPRIVEENGGKEGLKKEKEFGNRIFK